MKILNKYNRITIEFNFIYVFKNSNCISVSRTIILYIITILPKIHIDI